MSDPTGMTLRDEQTPLVEELRELFLIEHDLAFLNHGSFGAVPRPVFEEYQSIQRQFESSPVEYHGRRFNDLMREARQALATYVGADPLDLVFVTNATVAMNTVAHSMRLGAGDELLTTDHEYGAVDRMWRMLAARQGFTIRRVEIPVPIPSNSEEIVRILADGMTDRTRLLSISHITSPTALHLPIEQVCAEARSRGIRTLVDGAHAIGQITLDVPGIGADFYTSNLHKWLCAPKGSAFLWVRRELQESIDPIVASWGLEPLKEYDSDFIARHEYRGTREIAPSLATAAALRFFDDYRWDLVRQRCRRLVSEVRNRIVDTFGWQPLDSPQDREPLQMVAFILPDEIDAFALKDALFENDRVEVPVFDWNDHQTLRVSVQGYNGRRDIDRLIDSLERHLPSA